MIFGKLVNMCHIFLQQSLKISVIERILTFLNILGTRKL
jgi:hypothetical protein